jgi:signal transduction histidine kinase
MDTVTPAARQLYVGTKLNRGREIVIFLQDSGIGVEDEDRDRIFDPFFTTKPHGMGLGLAICRTIVQEHGGDLSLTQTGAHGSVFEITLPIETGHNRL